MKHIFSVLVVGWFNTYVLAQKVLWHQGGPWLLQNTLYQKAKFIKITGSIKLTIIETGECLGGHLTLKKVCTWAYWDVRDVHPKVSPQHFIRLLDNSLLPIYTLGWREALWEESVLPKNTTQWPGLVLNSDLSTWSPVHFLLLCIPLTLNRY